MTSMFGQKKIVEKPTFICLFPTTDVHQSRWKLVVMAVNRKSTATDVAGLNHGPVGITQLSVVAIE